MRAGEADAKLDEWGVMCPDILPIESTRNLFMTAYPRMIEILQLLGSSSFLLTPSEKDLRRAAGRRRSSNTWRPTARRARDRVKLFHLARDVACSAFGSRQVLYERFFASDPLTRARALNAIFPKQEVKAARAGLPADGTMIVVIIRTSMEDDAMSTRPKHLGHVNLYVRNAERSKQWYRGRARACTPMTSGRGGRRSCRPIRRSRTRWR